MSSLSPDSYTSRRLDHANATHLHLTTRRTFIGPIPEGWLKSHRKEWYRHYIQHGRKKAPTFTAAHPVAGDDVPNGESLRDPDQAPRPSSQSGHTTTGTGAENTTSTTSLLHIQRVRTNDNNASVTSSTPTKHATPPIDEINDSDPPQQDGPSEPARAVEPHTSAGNTQPDAAQPTKTKPADRTRFERATSKIQKPRVQFNETTRMQLRARAQRLAAKGNFRKNKMKPGELMKMDKMLVRIDVTGQSLGNDFDERASQSVVSKPLDKWREFMVVCRKHDDGGVLQLYQSRVIAMTAEKTKKKPKAQIRITPNGGKVNLFSSLDKTLCIWEESKGRTHIYYLRPQSGATSVEWYTFLRSILGLERARELQVNVPDLNVSLRLDDPFKTREASRVLAEAAEGDDNALARAVAAERGAAAAIVTRCLDMLKKSPEWTEVLTTWIEENRVGLAWKRYDRLEWVHGAVEQSMYGTIAMAQTHELELRPKIHYPLSAKTRRGSTVDEPPPVEGFLIRLTSQKGHGRRLGKMIFKRLYFTCQDQYLVFLRPARAVPPPPPKMPVQSGDDVPSAHELAEKSPFVFDVEPYRLDGNRISWLDTDGVKSAFEQEQRDRDAEDEAERNKGMLLGCDGFIKLCDVKKVRLMQPGATPADDDLDSGPDVNFDGGMDSDQVNPDGATIEVDEDRIFELLMKNGLVIRLQAYNRFAKLQWIRKLRELVQYWHHRTKQDMDLLKFVRQQNVDALQIDERTEAHVGSFAYKWEVSQSFASSAMYNLCGISACRAIHLSGALFRKPRRHATFTRCHVVLSAGHLLVFQDALRKSTGQKLVHIHHERISSIDLKGCYLYSGLLTEDDLLYRNRTFDSNTPGHNALPRIHLEDQWTSTDEDAMTTFCLWHAKSRSWFRSSHTVDDVRSAERQQGAPAANSASTAASGEESYRSAPRRSKTETHLEHVSKLGTKGRIVVFKARSRAERDHWVLALQVEIERALANERKGQGPAVVGASGLAEGEVRMET